MMVSPTNDSWYRVVDRNCMKNGMDFLYEINPQGKQIFNFGKLIGYQILYLSAENNFRRKLFSQ